MPDLISNAIIDDAVAQALQLDLCFLDGPGHTRHVPFSFTPCPISFEALQQLRSTSLLLGRLTQALAEQDELIQSVHESLVPGDPFFARMLATHKVLHNKAKQPARIPLLLQRSDFMLDAQLGPRLVECNSIAAGMAPFGERTGTLHAYLHERWPAEYAQLHTTAAGTLAPNPSIKAMAHAIAAAATQIAKDLGDEGTLRFLMVVQENEDNLFDQRLLEQALRERGVETCRRTFRQLHQQLSSGLKQSLQLEDEGTVHVAYLRAGYQFVDYIARDLDSRRCCDALEETRMMLEQHHVALNATVAQQLATSKRMQLHLVIAGKPLLHSLGFDQAECDAITAVLSPMRQVNQHSAQQLQDAGDVDKWVLKNQGEGGGHCLFDQDILHKLRHMPKAEHPVWTLMRRLRPIGRNTSTLIVRNARASTVYGLNSEIGLFTAHLGPQALPAQNDLGYIGYLVRSKPPGVTEGGVHSGFGALDSLFVEDPVSATNESSPS